MKRARGITRIEVPAVILSLLIIVMVAMLLPAPIAERASAIKDAAQIRQIHAAWLTLSRDFIGVDSTVAPELPTANTSAAIYSACIMMNYLTPQILVSPVERNPVVVAKDDYGWDLYDPVAGVYWDTDREGNPPPDAPPGYVPFATNLSSDNRYRGTPICNASYAHTPLCGTRAMAWRDLSSGRQATVGNRGVICGNDRNRAVYDASITLKFYGSHTRWIGNVAYNDNHVEMHHTFHPKGLTFLDSAGVARPDNLFRNDSEDGDCGSGLGIDAFLTLVSEIIDAETCRITTEWD